MSASKIVLNVLRICISILIMLLIVFGVTKFAMAAYDLGYRVFMEKPMEREPGTDVTVHIKKGMSIESISETLEDKGLIREAEVFVIQTKISPYEDKIKPGDYILNTSQTSREILEVLAGVEKEEEEE